MNSAGIMKMLPLATASGEDFEATFSTNVQGTFNVLQQAAKRLPDGGRIITFSTSVIAMSFPNYGPHAASKAAVEVLTRTLANELRGREITVNAVAPRPDRNRSVPRWQIAGADRPLYQAACRWNGSGTPEDIAGVVAFLAGPDGGWINGQVLRANGGYA